MSAMRARAPPTRPRATSTRPAHGGGPAPAAPPRQRQSGNACTRRRRLPWPHIMRPIRKAPDTSPSDRSTPIGRNVLSGRHTAARGSPIAPGDTPARRNHMPRLPRPDCGVTTLRRDTGRRRPPASPRHTSGTDMTRPHTPRPHTPVPPTGAAAHTSRRRTRASPDAVPPIRQSDFPPEDRRFDRARGTPHTPGPRAHIICTADTGATPPHGARIPPVSPPPRRATSAAQHASREPADRTGPGRWASGGPSVAPRRHDTRRRPRPAPMPSPHCRTGSASAVAPACATDWATPPP